MRRLTATLRWTPAISAVVAASVTPVRALTTTGILNGVQNELALRPGMPFSPAAVKTATEEFIAMGFDGSYDKNFSHKQIADHVYGYLCAKSSAGDGVMTFTNADETSMLHFTTAKNDVKVMNKIETFFKKHASKLPTHAMSVRSFTGVDPATKQQVVLYDCNFKPFADATGEGDTLEQLASVDFKTTRTEGATSRYRDLLERMKGAIGPVYNIKTLKTGNTVINVGFQPVHDGAMYLDELTMLVSSLPNVTVVKKFVESFSNGQQIYSIYTKGVSEKELADAVTMIGIMPPNRTSHPYMQLYQRGELTAKEVVYAFSVSQFAYYFAAPGQEGNYSALHKALEKDAVLLKRLKDMRNSMFQELMDEASISQVVAANVPLFRQLYADFQKGTTPESAAAMLQRINDEVPADTMAETNALFRAINTFNSAVKATNFYKTNRSAIAYRLDPSFLGQLDFPRVPYGVYMIFGSHFRGFHIRFHQISRGGVRMMLSKSTAEYKNKRKTLFQENYGLAFTQMLKNKDIPESGSKGTLLVSPRFDHKKYSPELLFKQYVDSLLDIMIPGVEGVRNSLPKRELLFLGPDENTAFDYPSNAAKWARARGFPEWKSLTTGKSSWDGGIPHDTFGMTTTSVREYLLHKYKDLGWEQPKLVKFQTGGPDGDLGSNEIILGREKQNAMCDISGCLYDPNGLDRKELERLAEKRLQVEKFDLKKLGKGGFFLPTSAGETTLPDGSKWTGSSLLANFHLTDYADADVFVPCGGRPASITIDNVHRALKGIPGVTGTMMLEGSVGQITDANRRWKLISEGANLFITPDARRALEKCGFIVFKDSSANKGGVTSSSIEVYTGLAMTDEDHAKLMCCDAKNPSPMYDALVKEIVQRIKDNAYLEYAAIERDVKRGAEGGQRQMLADVYSQKAVRIFEFVSASNLAQDEAVFRYVLTQYTPKTLLAQVPLDVILQRVPRDYLEAIFHKQVAIQYVYAAGADSNEFSFYEYMRDLQAKANGARN